MNRENPLPSFKNVTTLKNKFDKFVFEKSVTTLIILLCINLLIFLLEDNNLFGHRYTFSWYELTFYLFAMLTLIVEILVAKDFFEKIPQTFEALIRRKIIKDLDRQESVLKKFSDFMLDFENKLNFNVPIILNVFIALIVLLGLQIAGIFPIFFMPENFPFFLLLLNFFTIVIPMLIAGYMMSVVTWKCLVTGYFVHKFSTEFELSIQPSHPDRVAGFKPLGDLIFSMTLILIVASLALSVLTSASQINNSLYIFLTNSFSSRFEVVSPYYLYSTESLAQLSLGFTIVFSLIIFVFPILSTHRRMRSEKIVLISSLTEITNKIVDLNKQARKTKVDYTKRNALIEEINSLSKIYEMSHKTPVWPFDRDILLKFFTPQFFSLLSLLGVIQPIIDVISSWVK